MPAKTKPRLTELDLSKQGLREIPKYVAKERALHTLLVNKNELSSLPDFIKNLVVLNCLDFSDNGINSFPYDLPKSLTILRAGIPS
jgi:Leucine-rich repeat (LRR) protein